jgi:plasmid stabilization system protein ParE
MAREVVWTEPAWEDLAAAADYIARDSENYAAAFVEEVKEAAASLAWFAERGQVVPEFADRTIRELLIKPYRLVYEVADDKVLILTLIHGARRKWRT